MDSLQLRRIGRTHIGEEGFSLELEPAYRAGLAGLEGFSHLQVLWWFSGCDDARSRGVLAVPKPYVKAPESLGVFATRSPERPNPIALSCTRVIGLDLGRGIVRLDNLDAREGSPVLDLKPYTPSLDRVAYPVTPEWCAHWPQSVEDGGEFDWEGEFLF